MSAIANIVVFDGAAAPVSHTLVPVSVSRDSQNRVVAEYRETGLAVPTDAQPSLKLTLERTKSGVYKCTVRLSVPVMESVSGQNAAGYTAAPKVAYVNTVETTEYAHERSDVAGRRLVRQMMTNMLNNITTSVAAGTAGAIPELFDQLVSPT